MMHQGARWSFIGWILLGLLGPRGPLQAQDWREFKIKTGDLSAYAMTSFDDADWPTYPRWRQTEEGARFKGNLWMRGSITFQEHRPGVGYAMAIAAPASCEVYLDGRLIAANGVVGGSAAEEVPGQILFTFAIPPDLHTPGPHQLALRFSNHHGRHHFGISGMAYAPLNQLIARLRTMQWPLALSSTFFMVSVICLLLYLFSLREPALGLFALLSFLVGALFVVEQWRLVGYTYHLHNQRMWAILILSGLVNLFLPIFFLVMHGLSRYYAAATALLMILLGLAQGSSHDAISFGFFLAGLGMSLAVSGHALFLRRPHALWGFAGCVIAGISLLWSGMDFLEGPFFYCFILMILLMMVSLSLQIREARQKYHEAGLTSARLEIELLKKHIQPHFMLNTLTAAMEWVEQDPPAAVRFIAALAKEMRSLFTASGRKLIKLSEELAMCRAHLETQAFRTGREHHLTVTCDDENVLVPPAVLLTLIENGLTYGSSEEACHFHLTVNPDGTQFCFEVDQQSDEGEGGDGTGTRYIKARLEESYPGRWQFKSELRGDVWRSTMTIEKS